MELVGESRVNGGVASATLLPGRVSDETAFKLSAVPNKILEFDSEPTGWHKRHRLDDCQDNLYHQPEKMLMFAILVDAISCFDKLSAAAGMGRRRRWLEAKNWLWSNRQDWPFSYRNVCESLGFDPDYLRRGLLARINTAAPVSYRGEANGFRMKRTYRSGH